MLTIDLDRARIEPGQRVLDIGCGAGRHAYGCLRAGAFVVAMDTDEKEVTGVGAMVTAMGDAGEIDSNNGSLVVGDVFSLPIVDAVFDRVIVAEVLEHLLDHETAIAELVRVMRPGGVLAVSVPRAWPERMNWMFSHEYHETPGGHIRIYRKRDLVALIRACGLRLYGSHHVHGLHSPYWWLRCIVGVNNDRHPLVRAYHRLLIWDIMKKPFATRLADQFLNPIMGKSLVLYFEKPRS